MTQPTSDTLGAAIKKYRETDLRLSQSDLAWLADVSRGTISNLETSRVTLDERTWQRIRTALGLSRISVDEFNPGEEILPVLPAVAIQGIVEVIIASKQEPEAFARRAAARWRHLVQILTQDGPSDPDVEHELSWLAREVAIKAPPEKGQIIHSALQEFGWPARSTTSKDLAPAKTDAGDLRLLTRTVSGLSLQVRNFRDEVRGFDRLPIRVQDLLNHGLVVDYEIERESSPAVSVIDLVVVDEGNSPFVQRRELLRATRRWSTILMIAKYVADRLAPDKDPEEILAALERVFQDDENEPRS